MRKQAPEHVLLNIPRLRYVLDKFIARNVTGGWDSQQDRKRELLTEILSTCQQPHADKFLLEDVYDVKPKEYVRGRLDVGCFGILAFLSGYSDHNGDGPVLIENREGIPYVVVWADITLEEPTHTISLEGARESRRKV